MHHDHGSPRVRQTATGWSLVLAVVIMAVALPRTAMAAPLTAQQFDDLLSACRTAGWNASDASCSGISSWDTRDITSMANLFKNQATFDLNIAGWNTSRVTTMVFMFDGAAVFNQNIGAWNTAAVTRMDAMFRNAAAFDQNIGSWNTASVTNIAQIFNGATSFNQNIGGWNTGSVTNMYGTFRSAQSFNQNLPWDTSKVTTMELVFSVTQSFNGQIDAWNTERVTVMNQMFFQTNSFNGNISAWQTGHVTAMSAMFQQAVVFNGDLSQWDTSNVQTMYWMFHWAYVFNSDLSKWATSKVRTLQRTFDGAKVFNSDLSAWDTSSVTDMRRTFYQAHVFNGNIGGWDVSKVQNMILAFGQAFAFNQSLSGWQTGSATTMASMFQQATVFNGDLSKWDVSAVNDMSVMFSLASVFNGQIGAWNTSRVTTMANMFDQAPVFNANIDNWDTSSCTTMASMFHQAYAFNQSLSEWQTGGVTTMWQMFEQATAFNGDLSKWNTSAVTQMSRMLYNVSSFNGDLSKWDTSVVTQMSSMFYNVSSFHSDLSGWDVAQVTDMASLFWNASSFNGSIAPWNTARVTDMSYTFYLASSFNGDISAWSVGAVTDMKGMFLGATSFNRDISGWDTSSVTDMQWMFAAAFAFKVNVTRGWDMSNANTDEMFAQVAWSYTMFSHTSGGCPQSSTVSNFLAQDFESCAFLTGAQGCAGMMYSRIYSSSWGCRCCTQLVDSEGNSNWGVYGLYALEAAPAQTAPAQTVSCPPHSTAALQTPSGHCICDPGFIGPDGGPCTGCAAGTYTDVNGSAACQLCPAGSYLNVTNGTACVTCPANTVSAMMSTDITDCICGLGFTGPDGAACSACEGGTFKDVNGSTPCQACAAGTYRDLNGTACLACPIDHFSLAGSNAITDCFCNIGVRNTTAAIDDTVYNSIETFKITGLPYRGATCRTIGISHTAQNCSAGFECLSGFCVNASTISLNEINHVTTTPSNVVLSFSAVGTLQDGSCTSVTLNSDTTDVEARITMLENGKKGSAAETHAQTASAFETKYQTKILILVDQSDSIQAKDNVRLALMDYVQDLFAATASYGGLSLMLAGFDGRESLIHWTEGHFLSDVCELKDYIDMSMRDTGFTSTDLYSPYTEAIEILNQEIAVDAGFDGESYTGLIVFTDGTDRAGRIESLSVVADAVAASKIDMFYAVAARGESAVDYVDFLALAGRDGSFVFDSTSPADLAAPLSDLVQTLEIIMWQVWTKSKNVYVTTYCAATRSGAMVHFAMEFDEKPVAQFEVNTSIFDTTTPGNASYQCRDGVADSYQTEAAADYATTNDARMCNQTLRSVLALDETEVILEPVDGTPELYADVCPGTPCLTGYTCRAGFCIDENTVRLQMIGSETQSAPSNVHVAFSLMATYQNGTCGPVVFEDDEMAALSAMVAVRDETLPTSSTEAWMAIVPRTVAYTLTMFLLVDQSDSISVDEATIKTAVSGVVAGLFTAENAAYYTGGISIRIAGFDGGEALIDWTESTFSANVTEITDYIAAAMMAPSYTSTDLYGPYLDALTALNTEEAAGGASKLTTLVVMTDSTDRARRHTIDEVRAAVAASTVDAFFVIPVSGEAEAEFEDFKAIAGKEGVYDGAFTQADVQAFAVLISWRISLPDRNVYLFMYCSPLRSGTSRLELQYGNNAPLRIEVDSANFETSNPRDQCNASAIERFSGSDMQLADADVTASLNCDASDEVVYAFNMTKVEELEGLARRYTAYCPLVPCHPGFSCVSGFCVDLNSTRLQEIDHIVEPPSNVLVAFSLVATLQDGTCGPVLFHWDDTQIVEDHLVVKEDGEDAGVETFLGLVSRPLMFRLRVFLLVDQSDSVTSDPARKELLKEAVYGFVDGLFAANNTAAYRGGIEIRIAGFDGRETMIEWTEGAFVSNHTHIEQYINASMMGPTYTSTDLYGPYMDAIDVLDVEYLNSLNDTISDHTSLVIFTDGTDRARRHTIHEVRDKLAASNLSTAWVVPVNGEQDAEYQEFLNISGKDGIFPVDIGYKFLRAAFMDLFWRISVRTRNIYLLLFCSAVRSGATVDFELSWGDVHAPVVFDVDSSTFQTDDVNNQCDAAVAEACTGCERVLRYAEKDGLENIRNAQTCTCEAGYASEGTFCVDTNECVLMVDDCHMEANCSNTEGSFECACNLGFAGNGTVCMDIDECANNSTNDCHMNALCNNTYGSFTCACDIGYEGNGTLCRNINECTTNNTMLDDNCDEMGSTCTDTMGSFTCECNIGWNGTGIMCHDIDECMIPLDNCHMNATCNNTNGSFTCTCELGYEGNGTMCMDYDECTIDDEELDDNCNVNAFCNNTEGSFFCTCGLGYNGSGTFCVDIDECTAETDNCNPTNGTCHNTNGSFTCACSPGYAGDGLTCLNIDECASDPCHINATCTDAIDSFTCVCDEGLKGNGTFCSVQIIESRALSSQFEMEGITLEEFDTEGSRTAFLESYQASMYETSWTFDYGFEIGIITQTLTGLSIEVIFTFSGFSWQFGSLSIGEWVLNLGQRIQFVTGTGGSFLSFLQSSTTAWTALFARAEGRGLAIGLSLKGLPLAFEWNDIAPRVWSRPKFNARELVSAPRGLVSICGMKWGRGFQFGAFSRNMEFWFRRAFTLFLNIDISWIRIVRIGTTASPGSDVEIMYEIVSRSAGIQLTSVASRIETGFASREIDDFLIAEGLNISGTELLLAPEVFECETGYNASGENCTNIDECMEMTSTCDVAGGSCTDTDGSFGCACKTGFTGNGTVCTNTVECGTDASTCSEDAMCTDTPGSFRCACLLGYRGDGVECENIDECTGLTCEYDRISVNCSNGTEWFVDLHENYTAPENCTMMVETYEADCPPRHTCLAEGMKCVDTPGSFSCACTVGYNTTYNQTDGMLICENLDECALETDNCVDTLATCTDTPGSFDCSCVAGYRGNGTVCRNVLECEDFADNNCNALARCSDTVGSFTCACNTNYAGDGTETCDFSPAEGTVIVQVTVVFTAVLAIDPDEFRSNTTIQNNYLSSVSRSANVDISLVIIISIVTIPGRRLLADTTSVQTQMTIPEQQLNDISGNFEDNLKSSLAGSGLDMNSLSSLEKQEQTTPTPTAADEDDDDDDGVDGGIIGGTVAGVIALLALCGIGVFMAKQRQAKAEAVMPPATRDVEVAQPVQYEAPKEQEQPQPQPEPVVSTNEFAFYAPPPVVPYPIQQMPQMPPFMQMAPPPGMMPGSMPPMGMMPMNYGGSMPPMGQSFPPMGM